MICPNCGAKYEDDEIKCPYCGTENEKIAVKQKEERLKEMDEQFEEERRRLEALPKKAGRLTRKGGFVLLGIIVGLAIIGAVIAIVGGMLSSNIEYRTTQKHLKKLEDLYEKKDYEQVKEYLSKHSLYGISFYKYSEISDIVSYQEMFEQSLAEYKKRKLETQENEQDQEYNWDIYFVMKYSNWVLTDCMDYTSDDNWYGNEEELLQIAKDIRTKLEKEFALSEEELNCLESQDIQDEEIEKMAVVITNRVREMR